MCDPDVAAEWRVRFRLEAGEVATFNQRRLLHGRDCFTLHGGERHLQVPAPWPLSWHVPIVRRTQTLATRRARVALASYVSDGLAECTGRLAQGCYLNIDDFLNRHRTLSVLHGDGAVGLDEATRAGNSSWS